MSESVTDRPPRLLDAAVVGASAVVLVSTITFVSAGLAGVLGATLVVFVAAWFALGRRAYAGGRGAVPMLVILVAVCTVGGLVSPAFATFQVVAFPLAWMLAPGTRAAIAANLGVTVAISIGYTIGTSLLETLAVEGVSLAFSLAMGFWITRIENRSESRLALIEELTAAQDRVAALSRDAGVLEERERLARELHDTFTQSLTGIVMLAERAAARHPGDASLVVLEDAARQAMAEARGLVTGTANVPLDGGLAGALETLAGRFRRETGLQVTVDATADVPRGLEVVLLRCAQEGLANVRKHANASAVRIRVAREAEVAVLTVADDGTGPGDGDGFGISGIRDRLALVDGDVELRGGERGGSVLAVRVPLPTEAVR